MSEDVFAPIITALAGAQKEIRDGAISLRSGTVQEITPKTVIRLDGDLSPLVLADPWVLGPPLAKDQRVLSILWDKRRAFIGAGWLPEPVPEIPEDPVRMTNTNGESWRFDSGLQICRFNGNISQAIPSAYGSHYIGGYTWTYPQTFAETPTVSVGAFKWGTGASWGSINVSSSTNAALYIYDIQARPAGSTTLNVSAIGRWK